MPDLLVKLYELPSLSPSLSRMQEAGIIIRAAAAYEKQIVVDWVRDHFSQAWASECDVAFSNHPVSCILAIQNGEIAGFACYESTCRCFFGPTGVSDEHRGKGIGSALLIAALHGLSNLGYAYAIIGGAGPVDFYKRTVEAVEIEGSVPGIYRHPLRQTPQT